MSERREYLEPYQRAAERHGAGFGALLWASPATQAARFDSICSLVNLEGKRVLDVGCGRADLLDFIAARGVRVGHYVGIEAVPELAEAARAKRRPAVEIVEADFVREPERLAAARAETVVISGALNTMDSSGFYATIRRAYDAAGEALVFNFLCSTRLAGASYLSWHPADEVTKFARTISPSVRTVEGYLSGDCTVGMWRDVKT